MKVIECRYGGPPHEFPDDWIMGGANGEHPGADPRWRPTTYEYLDDKLDRIHVTQTPMCEDQAIDEFTKVAGMGKTFNPVYLFAVQQDKSVKRVPWTYDKETDVATLDAQ